MPDHVWISTAYSDSRAQRGYRAFEAENEHDTPEIMIEAAREDQEGLPLPRERFPENFWAMSDLAPHRKGKRHLFTCGFWVVSAEAAAVLREFDLGRGGLYPTKLWYPNRKKQVEGEYFCLNIGNVKDTLLEDKSTHIKQVYGTEKWQPRLYGAKDVLFFSDKALEGPDIWVEKRMISSFMVSNSLMKALKDEKIASHFFLTRCFIVENSE